MDKFYRNRCIINLCQTGQLTQTQIAQSMEISQGRVSQLYGQFQEDFAGRVQLALLPAYSPQLNAAEPVWAWLKGGQLNVGCCQTLDELTRQVQKAFAKLTENTEIIQQFFEHPEVSFY